MRVEIVNGRHLLCGGMIHSDQIKVGQEWAAADGSDHVVTVAGCRRGRDSVRQVTYSGPSQPQYEKDAFSFQCRYCLVLDGPAVPSEFQF